MKTEDGDGEEVWSWEPDIVEPSAPFFFQTVSGTPIRFFVFDDNLSKQRIEKLILAYGGSVCCDQVDTSTITLVKRGFNPPPDWGPCYYRDFIRHCIEINQILELSEYLVQGVHSPLERYLSACLYNEKLKFRQSPLSISHFSVDSNDSATSGTSLKSLHRFIGQPRELRINFNNGKQQVFVGTFCGCLEEFKVSQEVPVSNNNDGESVCDKVNGRSVCDKVNGSKSKFSALEYRLSRVKAGEIKNQEMGVKFIDLSNRREAVMAHEPTSQFEQVTGSAGTEARMDISLDISISDNSSPLVFRSPICGTTTPTEVLKDNVEPPKDNLGPPKDNVEPPKGYVEPPKDNLGPPKDNVEPPKDNVEPPKDNVEPPGNQSSDSDSDVSIDLSSWPRLFQFHKTDKHTRNAYSKEEKEAILEYIVLKKAYNRLKSDALYKEMEAKNICPKRTYQSIKNHFLKTMIYELDTFPFLTETVKAILLERTLTPSMKAK